MSNEGTDMLPEYHVHICSICEHTFNCEEKDCDETDDTAICEECLEYDDDESDFLDEEERDN